MLGEGARAETPVMFLSDGLGSWLTVGLCLVGAETWWRCHGLQ